MGRSSLFLLILLGAISGLTPLAVDMYLPAIPTIADEPWSKGVFAAWEENEDISKPVKNAMKARRGNGNVSVK